MLELCIIPIGGRDQAVDQRPDWDRDPGNLDHLARVALRGHLDRAVKAQQFLDRRRVKPRVRTKTLELIRELHQSEGSVADEVDRGLVAGHYQQEHHRHGLVLPQPLACLLGLRELRDQVVMRLGPLGRDHPPQVADEAPDRGQDADVIRRGVTGNTVARWERNEVRITEPMDRLIRLVAQPTKARR